MNEELKNKIKELIEVVEKTADSTATAFTLFINSQEFEIHWNHRTPKQLKKQGISMKNLSHNWIE